MKPNYRRLMKVERDLGNIGLACFQLMGINKITHASQIKCLICEKIINHQSWKDQQNHLIKHSGCFKHNMDWLHWLFRDGIWYWI